MITRLFPNLSKWLLFVYFDGFHYTYTVIYLSSKPKMIEILQKYGFSEKEAKVYLASLQLGSAPGSTIARHAGEKRVTVYSLLKELTKK